ncbi:uncharacterized protein LOC131144008 [Malania oleifera]|uniref:uncharacterized protein LOC131144008 n=1 Tax=Malania oleifera TaxID=397392 RepID=UPI0025ADEAE1|nr:uncharacterized protein LOC131144008 [Malania oleifera]
MAEMARSTRERGYMIEQFMRMKPPSFAKKVDPIVAENWVQDIEEILVVLSYTDKHKVSFTSFKLTGEAKCWWRSARLIKEQRPNPVPVTWSRFKELFFERYFPSIIRSAKATNFLHLAQGQMIVSQYAAQFIELSHFASHLAPDEDKKVRKFEEGLRQNLYVQVIDFQAQTFVEVVDRAAVIENGMQGGVTAQSQRKRPTPQDFQTSSSQGPWRGDQYGGSQARMMGRSGPQGGRTIPICPKCGRRHPGECRMGEGVCYHCGRPGHRSWSCQGLPAQGPAPKPFRGGYQAPRGG